MPNGVLVPTRNSTAASTKITLTGKHLIGRALHNTTVIEDVSISRSHCYFEEKDGSWYLTDTSSNGTTINGDLIQNATRKLNDHDIVGLSTQIAYEYLICAEPTPEQITDEVLNEIADTVLEATRNSQSGSLPKSQPQTAAANDDDEEDSVDDEFQCSICTELFIKAVTLSCSHTFCKKCIDEWRKNQTICPICRAQIQNQFPTIVLDNYIEKIVEKRSEEYKNHRKMVIAEREPQPSAVPGPSTSNPSKRRRTVPDPIEISSSSGSEDEDEDEETDGESQYDVYMFEYFDHYYNGIPGHYYGGYGSCYKCGQRGHWANGCPFRRRL
ncbi:hypothetical protein PPYR_03528 [Photinus pyralis]|uniref:E3 ubiquitin-protein ligase CHFR n=1 Tax=Photinus pyralis TaxID=7054 RepID=A0A1Y1KG90_PHOPY|nr:RING finger protein 141-like [Photinus pyralis]KAB0791728.1 hypothetical protein PPYR_03528 [Photinus pyralis]